MRSAQVNEFIYFVYYKYQECLFTLRYFNKRDEFYYKKSHLETTLQQNIIRDGVAYIPCKIDGINDIVSKFSKEGAESLDGEFVDYILNFVDSIPDEYPVVLEIYGPKIPEETKQWISKIIMVEGDYLLGQTEAKNRHHRRVFWWMLVGTIGSGVLLGCIKKIITDDVPVEFFYVLFWLFADAFVRYLFIENTDYKNDKIRAGRIASMKVEFVEN